MRGARYLPGLVVAVLSLSPASASATWGKKCNEADNSHCYGLAQWVMTGEGEGVGGSGEEVKGLSSTITTYHMLVPLWENGDFVSDEQWMSDTHGRWVEDGQLAGAKYASEEGKNVNGYSLHWFYASDNGSEAPEFVAPWGYEGGEFISYTLDDPYNNGVWC